VNNGSKMAAGGAIIRASAISAMFACVAVNIARVELTGDCARIPE